MEKPLAEQAVQLVSASVTDLQCSLKNGLNQPGDLPLLRQAHFVIISRSHSKTMERLLDTRIRKIEKQISKENK
jgi:hypothetical protein